VGKIWAVIAQTSGDNEGGAGKGTEHLRAKLAARREDCFERLEDAVSELYALHSVSTDEIVARIQRTTA
jgi:hypothetical protein